MNTEDIPKAEAVVKILVALLAHQKGGTPEKMTISRKSVCEMSENGK